MWRSKKCPEPQCRLLAERGKDFCAEHQEQNYRLLRHSDKVNRMYSTVRWLGFRKWILGQNPVCQRIDAGSIPELLRDVLPDGQCIALARIVHHLVSPRERPDLFCDPTNVVCVCEHHHPNEAGTPHWKVGVDYVRTEHKLPTLN